MERINMNDFAISVSLDEGKKESVNIAQIKEVISITMKKLAEHTDAEIMEVVGRYRG
jgi:hypothetical protein